jgi:hypothetical protein
MRLAGLPHPLLGSSMIIEIISPNWAVNTRKRMFDSIIHYIDDDVS